ncbi:MAG: SIMPL domain-containing protein, partial [Albidovulum sp.]
MMRNLGILLTVLALAFPAAAADFKATVSVTGEGQVDIAPDMATLTLGVVTEATSAKTALDQNSTQLAAVIARLKETGIADRDVQTSGLSLGPRYDYGNSNGAPKLVGYTATNMVSVRVRALDQLGGVLDSVVSDGANALNGLGFGLQDPGPATDEARRRAVADA